MWDRDDYWNYMLIPALRFNSGPGAHAHETESYEQFNNRYLTFFSSCNDLFELQRGLNNCFAYDLVPAPSVIDAALQSARRINNYGSAVRILDAVKVKVENKQQYQTYLDELKGTIQELGEFGLCYCGISMRTKSWREPALEPA